MAPRPVEQDVEIDAIDPHGGTQMRVRIDEATVQEYAEAMVTGPGATFPPIDVYREGKVYWLADGFHRFRAARSIKARSIRALVHVGTRSDAIAHAIGANKANGLRRTNADKQMAVRAALAHERLREWSDRAIAEFVGVSNTFVSRMREGAPAPQVSSVDSCSQPSKTTRTGADGKERRLPRNPPQAAASTSGPAAAARKVLTKSERIACPHCGGTGWLAGS